MSALRVSALRVITLCVVLASGCATCPPLPPLPVTHTTYRPERPELPAATLQPTDSPDTVVRSLLMTIEVLQGYAEQLEALLD